MRVLLGLYETKPSSFRRIQSLPVQATTTATSTKRATTEDYIKHKKLEEEERARKERRARRRERRRLRNALALEGATSEHTTRTVSPSFNNSDLFDSSIRSYSTVGSMVSAVTLSPGVLNNRMTTRRTTYRHHRPIGNWKTIQADPCGLTPTKKSKVMN